MPDSRDLARIGAALEAVVAGLRYLTPDRVTVERKRDGDPVTEADRVADAILRRALLEPGEGWLSEETTDEPSRLRCRRVWVVDPIDGTRQFLAGVPEWCASVALVEDGVPVAGGTCNPATGETILGGIGHGVRRNGQPVRVSERATIDGALVLASRSEVRRGLWDRDPRAPFEVRAMGSVAYKLSLVAAGLADATWSYVPKHEWDVAAGVALVRAGGGTVTLLGPGPLVFNRPEPRLPGLLAASAPLAASLLAYLEKRGQTPFLRDREKGA